MSSTPLRQLSHHPSSTVSVHLRWLLCTPPWIIQNTLSICEIVLSDNAGLMSGPFTKKQPGSPGCQRH